LEDSGNPLRIKFEELLKQGHDNDAWQQQTRHESGQFSRLPDYIREPVSESSTSKPKRDRSREPQAGTSIGYAL
jgi:hypothetical protein